MARPFLGILTAVLGAGAAIVGSSKASSAAKVQARSAAEIAKTNAEEKKRIAELSASEAAAQREHELRLAEIQATGSAGLNLQSLLPVVVIGGIALLGIGLIKG